MKSGLKVLLVLVVSVAAIAGFVLGQKTHEAGSRGGPEAAQGEVLYWVAPMDPNFRKDKPGKSPMGMDLVPVYEGDEGGGDEGVVHISAAVANNIGIRTARVERKDLSYTIDTVGFVAPDETRRSHAHVRAPGWIEDLVARVEGQRVAKGDLLFRIYAPDLVVAQSDYLQALKDGNMGGNKAYEKIAREKLKLLGFHDRQIAELKSSRSLKQVVDVYAHQGGVITSLNVAENMYVTPATSIMTILDLSTIWVMADVFEGQSGWLAPGQMARVETSFRPGVMLEGRVEYIYPMVDPTTRTVQVRLVFDNADETLKPNMFARVHISTEQKGDVLVIEQDALIRTGRSQRVIRHLGQGRFEPVEVETGLISDGQVEIVAGLEAGQEIVVSGQFLIDSEASVSASLRRMSDPGTGPDEAVHSIAGRGTVKAVMSAMAMITLAHEPIPAIGWPMMTMDFSVSPRVDLSQLGVGMEIHFELVEVEDGSYLVTSVRPVPAQ